MTDVPPTDAQAHDAQSGVADAFAHLSEETQLLVRQEMQRARDELWERAKSLAPAAGLLAAGGGMGVAAAASAYRLVLRILERMTSPALAAFLATAAFGAGSVVALKTGREQLRGASLPLPVSSATTAAEDAARAVEQVTASAG